VRFIPETANRQDWPRLVASVLNETQRKIEPAFEKVTANYTVKPTDFIVAVDATAGPVTVTLPLPDQKRVIYVKLLDASGNGVTVNGNGATIDGAATLAWTTRWASYTLASTGSEWFIV